MKAAKILISGKVQGVYFRVSAKQVASEFDIQGWCRNTLDDKVEIFAQGNYHNLTDFFNWCNKGPEQASVHKVEVDFVEPERHESFEIRY